MPEQHILGGVFRAPSMQITKLSNYITDYNLKMRVEKWVVLVQVILNINHYNSI